MRAVVFGVSGGIGRALAEGLVARGADEVYGFSRSAAGDIPGVEMGRADITRETDLAEAAARVAASGPPELVIVATGLLRGPGGLEPEKSYRQQDLEAFEQVFRANTFGPALVAKHFLPIMPRRERAVFAALSARVGSISDNRIGGWHAYRASKAALNMLIRNYAIEQGRRNSEFIAVGLHPGTVDTKLSEAFQANVPAGKLFSPEYSAGKLLDVLENLTPQASGHVFDYSGAPVPA